MPKPLWAPWRLEYVQHADELDRCIFCEPEPELLVHDGKLALVVLNKFPYSSGHLLIAPKRHLGDFAALSAQDYSRTGRRPSEREARRGQYRRAQCALLQLREISTSAPRDRSRVCHRARPGSSTSIICTSAFPNWYSL